MSYIDISIEVAKQPGREPTVKQRENGEIEIIFQLTQKEMDEFFSEYLKKRVK